MIDLSASYYAAITADARRVLLRAIIDIINPDISYGTVEGSGEAPFSRPEQLHDKIFALSPPYATLERNRWLLDGRFQIFPDDYQAAGEVGYAGGELSGDDGTFDGAQYVQLGFSNVSMKLYPGDRHEILNELDRAVVYDDIEAWIRENVKSR